MPCCPWNWPGRRGPGASPGTGWSGSVCSIAWPITPKHLSGGEQQRVALARAFAPAPRLILADEPTGNLDAATGHQVIDLMFELNARQGTTLILVTHDEEVAARCGRVLRIAGGHLI